MSLIRTSRTWPASAPRTATGPVQMWPGSFGLCMACTADRAGGTASGGGGIISGGPDTVEIVIVSPLSTRRQPRVEIAPMDGLGSSLDAVMRHDRSFPPVNRDRHKRAARRPAQAGALTSWDG